MCVNMKVWGVWRGMDGRACLFCTINLPVIVFTQVDMKNTGMVAVVCFLLQLFAVLGSCKSMHGGTLLS